MTASQKARTLSGRLLGAAVLAAGLCWGCGSGMARAADPATLAVRVDQPGVKISPALYGLMTEEINHGYDGGLYAELIQNRIFQDTIVANRGPRRDPNNIPPLTTRPVAPPALPLHWSLVSTGGAGKMVLDADKPVNTVALTQSLRLDFTGALPAGGGGNGAGVPNVGVANDGFWGIPVKPNTTYHASFYARRSADFSGGLTVGIESNDGTKKHASGGIAELSTEWKKYELDLKTGDTAPSADNRFVISGRAQAQGSIWLSLVSLFPPTYHNRPNGLRPDIMELLAGLNPAFLRFPGGNYVQGDYFNERFNWKETIGPLEQRPGHITPWNYRSSDGMGLLEFLLWCEDLKMEPVLAVFAGYALKLQGVSGPALEPYVQEALEEIEYVRGGPETKWGQQRAKDGHPEPFKLRYVEIGNEDSFDPVRGRYDVRFGQFFDAIKAKYPDLQVISTLPGTTRKPDMLDEHFYRAPAQMAGDAHHYDKTDRNGPKIMVGEYASREALAVRTLTPTLRAALGDAAFVTGLERNSDLVLMSCYAPLLTNVNRGASQWLTDLIGFDALGSFGSPSYYAIKMFAENRGDVVLPAELKTATAPATRAAGETGPAEAEVATMAAAGTSGETLFVAASRDAASGDVILKLVNTLPEARRLTVTLSGVKEVSGGTIDVLTGDPGGVNSVETPRNIAPKRETLAAGAAGVTAGTATFSRELAGSSVNVVRLKVK